MEDSLLQIARPMHAQSQGKAQSETKVWDPVGGFRGEAQAERAGNRVHRNPTVHEAQNDHQPESTTDVTLARSGFSHQTFLRPEIVGSAEADHS